MADFVAVLKKALDGLGETTPETRARVYDKARTTIANKLAAITPPPPAAVAQRQTQSLEDAIATVEAGYAKPVPAPAPEPEDPLAELESIFSSIDRNRTQPAQPKPAEKAAPPPVVPAPPPVIAERKPDVPPTPADKPAPPTPSPVAETPRVVPVPEVQKPTSAPVQETPRPEPVVADVPKVPVEAPAAPKPAPKPAAVVTPQEEPDLDEFLSLPPRDAQQRPALAGDDVLHADADDERPASDNYDYTDEDRAEKKRGGARLLIAAVVLVALGGAGYGAWLNRDAIAALIPQGGTETAEQVPAESETPAAPAQQPAAPAQAETETPPPAAPATTPPASEQAAAPAQDAEPGKFTQRLNADGTEVDPGPASGENGVGEGTSVAALTQAPPAAPIAPAAPEAAQPAQAETPPPAASGDQSLSVAQKAIFYEERTNVAQGSAQPGNVVWSVVQESPGGDLPPEPAIRAEATIPGKDVQLRMTIRRNTDQTLPASHIIEMIFLTPDGFEGGGIENILRVAMKSSEQDAGNALLGIPAKIADGFFLVALNDTKAETDANLTLMRRQSWIDIPVVYKSGRRALFTLEKGVPGERIFEEAMRAWQTASAG
ncbi:hypothetical protein [Oryzicola mucosus]|uniref:Uncharacterized protein n=1 Tax=Oryzicola mucosus TaxID=2767425 RepID=A0A8J6PUP4_9HYPH|nr:hypothetical protein [Oryzicola mucosus]MBD0414212.1 hypothetical protein [Oryzicola mucosus]